MNSQVTHTVFMVRPVGFHGNEQTAVNNYFQSVDQKDSQGTIQKKALQEFDDFVLLLKRKGIEVIIFEDTGSPQTPDSIFPNNWISTHQTGQIITYPMFAENRRLERRNDIITSLSDNFQVKEIIRLECWEEEKLYLEGTGSLVLDRQHNHCFVALSDRAYSPVIQDFQEITGYHAVVFQANQTVHGRRVPIYHTNVMMYLGEAFAVVGLECIDDLVERNQVIQSLESLGKEIIEISESQVEHFAGNGLELENKSGDRLIVMSTSAFGSLNQNQLKALEKYGEVIHSPMNTIEHYGGGSARCTIAEIFLSKKAS